MILDELVNVASWLFILAGSAGIIISTFGLVRLPDFYTRVHAGGVTDTMGAVLMIIGMAIQGGFGLVTVKLFIIAMFLLFTGPTATHAAANAAWVAGLKPEIAERPDEDNDEDSHGDRP